MKGDISPGFRGNSTAEGRAPLEDSARGGAEFLSCPRRSPWEGNEEPPQAGDEFSWWGGEEDLAKEVVLPELGEEINEATVSYWLHQEGDEVKEGEDLVEMTTDKATFNVPSPASGTLKEISAGEGETVKVGQKLGAIE